MHIKPPFAELIANMKKDKYRYAAIKEIMDLPQGKSIILYQKSFFNPQIEA
jgi:hypothetical protein